LRQYLLGGHSIKIRQEAIPSMVVVWQIVYSMPASLTSLTNIITQWKFDAFTVGDLCVTLSPHLGHPSTDVISAQRNTNSTVKINRAALCTTPTQQASVKSPTVNTPTFIITFCLPVNTNDFIERCEPTVMPVAIVAFIPNQITR
jgi:hypothetical protein